MKFFFRKNKIIYGLLLPCLLILPWLPDSTRAEEGLYMHPGSDRILLTEATDKARLFRAPSFDINRKLESARKSLRSDGFYDGRLIEVLAREQVDRNWYAMEVRADKYREAKDYRAAAKVYDQILGSLHSDHLTARVHVLQQKYIAYKAMGVHGTRIDALGNELRAARQQLCTIEAEGYRQMKGARNQAKYQAALRCLGSLGSPKPARSDNVSAPDTRGNNCTATGSPIHLSVANIVSSTGNYHYKKPDELKVFEVPDPDTFYESECRFELSFGDRRSPPTWDKSVVEVPERIINALKGSFRLSVDGRISSSIQPGRLQLEMRIYEQGMLAKDYRRITVDGNNACFHRYSLKPEDYNIFSGLSFHDTAKDDLVCFAKSRRITITASGFYYGRKPTPYNPGKFHGEDYYQALNARIMTRIVSELPDYVTPPTSGTEPVQAQTRTEIHSGVSDQDHSVATALPDPETTAKVAAAIAAVLIAAGIAVQVANAIAAALAQAVQAGVELTSEEINAAISEGLAKSASQPPQESPEPPVPKGPTLYDKEGQPFERNEQGQYWAPNAKGKWVWMGEADAREASAALRGERAAREAEIRDHDRQTDAMMEQWRRDTQVRHAAERAQEAAERERLEERMRHITEEGEESSDVDEPSMDELVDATPGIDNTAIGWGINLAKEFVQGSARDSIDLITQSPGAIADAIASAASSAGKLLSDPENWRIGIEGTLDTLADLTAPIRGDVDRTMKTAINVAEGGMTVGKIGGHLLKKAWEDPSGAAVAVGRTLLGVDNWEKAIDPDVPVTERMGRALWGTVDTGGVLVSAGSLAVKGANKLGGLIRIAESAADALKGAKAVDAAVDATKAVDAASDIARAADMAGDAMKSVDAAGDVTKSIDAASDAVRAADVAGDATKGTKAAENSREAAEAIKRNRDLLSEGRIGGPNTERRGIPNMATDPEGYVRELPTGALVDRNLATGTGYTGAQIDDMAKFAKGEDVIVGARSTNIDSMRHIRDGNALPKPVTIKSKTINEADTFLGMNAEDKGLVGYFKPNEPDPKKVPEHLWETVQKRFAERADEYKDLKDTITQYVNEGKMVERDGKLHAVIRKADGTTELKPFAGDIDGVYFRDAKTDKIIPPGERYDRLKAAWTGNTEAYNRRLAAESAWKGEKPDFVPNYWEKSGAPGQHGVETNLVADCTAPYKPGTPEYDKALAKYRELHAKLADNHWQKKGETVMEMRPDGNLRRGIRFTEDAPLPDMTQ